MHDDQFDFINNRGFNYALYLNSPNNMKKCIELKDFKSTQEIMNLSFDEKNLKNSELGNCISDDLLKKIDTGSPIKLQKNDSSNFFHLNLEEFEVKHKKEDFSDIYNDKIYELEMILDKEKDNDLINKLICDNNEDKLPFFKKNLQIKENDSIQKISQQRYGSNFIINKNRYNTIIPTVNQQYSNANYKSNNDLVNNSNHYMNNFNKENSNLLSKSKLDASSELKKKKQFIEREGDWVCMRCKNKNFSFRIHCNRCKLYKNESEEMYGLHMNYLMNLVRFNEEMQNQIFNNSNCEFNKIINKNQFKQNFDPKLFSANSCPIYDKSFSELIKKNNQFALKDFNENNYQKN